jgi:hypothetical protein
MKKIFTLFLLIGSTILAQAQSIEGVISFTNLSRQPVTIEVDGKQYANFGSAMTIRNLSHGIYKVKVFGRSFHRGNNNRPLLYDNTVWIKSRVFVDIIINRFGRVFVDEQEIRGNWPDDDGALPVFQTMNDYSFQSLLQVINKENFDSAKMPIIKQVADQNYFTAEQVKQLVPLFTFDDSQLEVAKYLYGRTVDKQNYFIVYSAFKFPFTKDKLIEYIRDFK